MSGISTVVISYNEADNIARCLQSVAAFSDEIIVVDNGSTDNTATVLEPYADRVQLVTVKQNRGVSIGRNAGAARASGAWLLFLDADDELKPTAIKDFCAAAQDSEAGLIFGTVEQFDETTGKSRMRSGEACAGAPPFPAKMNIRGCVITTPGAAIVRRDLHERIGGYEKPWQPTEDRDYLLKCGVSAPFQFCEPAVIRKHHRKDSTVRQFSAKAIYWGMRVQIEFLDWCTERSLDTSFLEFSREQMVAEALDRALSYQDWPVSKLVTDYAREHRIGIAIHKRLFAHAMQTYHAFRCWTLKRPRVPEAQD